MEEHLLAARQRYVHDPRPRCSRLTSRRRRRGVTDSQTDLFEDDPSQENEDDLEEVKPSTVAEAVVTGTDWTTGTILDQVKRGNINLSPRFQRRDAWSPQRKSKFIESVFLGLPIPQLVLAENRDRRGTYLVIDGKQRLLALAQFAAESGSDFTALSLSGLEVREDLNGITLEGLRSDSARSDDLAAFENQTIRTVVVRNWSDDEFLFLVFLRLNTGSVPLSPQELRQALHPGPFVDFIDEFSIESAALRRALELERPDFRMRDVELVLRFFAFSHFLEAYRGNLKKFLDSACDSLNKAWEDSEDELISEASKLDDAITATFDIFENDAFHRWNGTKFEGRFNRAVFDIMVFYFSKPDVATRARERAGAVVAAFKQLSDEDRAFSLALQTTTKTMAATAHRLIAWGETLGSVTDLDIRVPTLTDETITY
jgi:uncharacterized protein DUF262